MTLSDLRNDSFRPSGMTLSDLRSSVKVEVDILFSPSLAVLMVPVDEQSNS